MREPRHSFGYVCAFAMLLLPTPASSEIRIVQAGGDLQAAIDAAQPGDVILLEPGAVFVGNFGLPAKSNPTGQYIIIRSAAPSANLPPSGVRITPAYAAALPVIKSADSLPALWALSGAAYYRLEALEFQENVSGGSDIIRLGSPSETDPALQPHHVVMDRLYVHGHPTDGQKNGIGAHGRHIELINSYVSDIKLVGVETHAFISYNGPGPYLLENNYLEASGINVIFGGVDPTSAAMTPADITIRGNHIAKNTAWMSPRPDGKYWTVKNLLELKLGLRVLIEGNLFENNWYGAGDQSGYALLMRTENQSGNCSWCETGDVTFQNNMVRRSSAALSLIGLDYPSGGSALGTRMHDVVLRNNLFAEIDRSVWHTGTTQTNAKFGLINGVDRLTLDHNTLVMPSQEGIVWFAGSTKSLGFTYTNNMSEHKLYGFKGDGMAVGNASLNAYTANYVFVANVLAGGNSGVYPTGNVFPTVASWQAQFVDYAGGNYRLLPGSVYATAATDGGPLGADIAVIEALIEKARSGNGGGGGSNQPPTADPGGPYGALSLTPVLFNGSGSSDPDGTIVSHVWSWGDGSPDSAGATASHQYARSGAYTVVLIVADNAGATATATTTATISNRPPTAEAGGPYTAEPGIAVAADASGSSDLDGSIVSYRWNWGDGSPATTSTSPAASHVYGAAGTYSVVLTATDNEGATASDTATVTVQAAAAAPFGGTPAALPGTIQAENFDEGGQSVAYFDRSAGNAGGKYRATDVDIESTNDAGGGYNVGWIGAGEWLKYTVKVAAASAYTLEARVASNGAGGSFHLEVNGVNVSGPMAVPNTGGWQRWITLRVPALRLNAGEQIWRLVMDTNGATTNAVGNVNYLRLTADNGGISTPYGGTPASFPGTFEAENFDEGGQGIAYFDLSAANNGGKYRTTGVDIQTTTDVGGGFNVGWISAGEWLNYTVNVGEAGTYAIQVRVASSGTGGTFHIDVNGVDKTGPLLIPNTGGWQTWRTLEVPGVSLNAGPQVWRVVMDANGPTGGVGNMNWVRVVKK